MELLSTFIVWLSPAVCSRDITMYLVLSAFTSSPVSLVATTRALLKIRMIKNINTNKRYKISWQSVQLSFLKLDSRSCVFAAPKTHTVCSKFRGRLCRHDMKRFSEVSKTVGATIYSILQTAILKTFVHSNSLSPIKENKELNLSASSHSSQKLGKAFQTNLISYTPSACPFFCPSLIQSLTFYSLLVTWCTNSLTFNNLTLCPHCI